MAKDRFDLENDINAMWSTAADLKIVAEMMYDSDFIYNADRTWNVLYGLAEIMEAKIGKLEDTFCQVFELNEYSSPEVKQAREEMFNAVKEQRVHDKWKEFFDAIEQENEGM